MKCHVLSVAAMLCLFGLATSYAAPPSAQDLSSLGIVTVNEYGAKGDGVTDDTAAIQAAVDAAYKQQKVCLFPTGTYLVSDTIKCHIPGIIRGYQKGGKPKITGDTHFTPYNLIGSTAGARPTIRLAKDAAGFNDINNPKPVIHILLFADTNKNGVWDQGEDEGNANLFCCGVRNLHVEVQAGNAGAEALDFSGSQHCFVEDFSADLRAGGFCGLRDLCGQNCVMGNIEIVGGKYGIYARSGKYPAITGLKLIDQTDCAIYRHNCPALTISGFQIKKASAPAIITEPKTGDDGNGHIALVDGTIEFETDNGKPAIDNEEAGRTVVLRNVYAKNASIVAKGKDKPALAGAAAGWKKIEEYVFCFTGGKNLVEGQLNSDQISNGVADCTQADVPADLISRHLWDAADWPSPDVVFNRASTPGSGYAIVPTSLADDSPVAVQKDNEGTDVREQVQKLIDENEYVLLPKGKFLIGKPGIVLGKGKRLVGLGQSFSGLVTHSNWKPTREEYDRDETALLSTVDDAAADPHTGNLFLGWSVDADSDWHLGFLWRAGRHSMIRGLYMRQMPGDANTGNPKADFKFTGNAGGRHYAIGLGPDIRSAHAEHIRMLISGTHEPLNLHNINCESCGMPNDPNSGKKTNGSANFQAQIRDSRNVAIYGSKCEERPMVLFYNCDNCAYFGAAGNASAVIGTPDGTEGDCDDMYFACWGPKKTGFEQVSEFHGGQAMPAVQANAPLGVFKRGACDFEALRIAPTASASTQPAASAPAVAAAE